jgi:hypothetical protein
VEERLAGVVVAPSGVSVPGPAVSWKGAGMGRDRTDGGLEHGARNRSLAACRSTSRTTRPCASAMRPFIKHCSFKVGECCAELTARLRTGRVLRVPRARTRGRGKTFISPEIMISQRPAEAADRAVPGHWEGDLILGLGSSAIGTLVERTTRFTMLLHLPRLAGHGSAPRMKNGPRARRPWPRGCSRCHRAHDRHLTRAAPPVADLGSRGRD